MLQSLIPLWMLSTSKYEESTTAPTLGQLHLN
jgi:hypothetical protein